MNLFMQRPVQSIFLYLLVAIQFWSMIHTNKLLNQHPNKQASKQEPDTIVIVHPNKHPNKNLTPSSLSMNDSEDQQTQPQNPEMVERTMSRDASHDHDHHEPPLQGTHFINNTINILSSPSSPLRHFCSRAPSSNPQRYRNSPYLVVTFVGSNYLRTMNVWLHHYRKHLDHNQGNRRILLIVALSDTAFHEVQSFLTKDNTTENIGPTIVMQANKSGMSLWALRVKLLQGLATTFPCLDLLFTDLDALWLQDPHAAILSSPRHRQSDIIASRGKFPPVCSLTAKDTACFGFIYFRNSIALRELLSKVDRAMPQNGNDDQHALNCVLAKDYELVLSNSWQTLKDGNKVGSYRSSKLGNSTNITISLLPYSQVIRQCKSSAMAKRAVVAHCLTSKTGTAKMAMFKRMNLLPPNLTNTNTRVPSGGVRFTRPAKFRSVL